MGLMTALAVVPARAEEPPPAQAAPAADAADAQPAPAPAPKPDVVPPKAAERKVSLEPKLAEKPSPGRVTFDIDPFADSALIGVSLAFAGTLELVNSTGEIRPQQIAPNFDRSQLLGIDRAAVNQTPDPKASGYSTLGLTAALAFAAVDPVVSGIREKSVQTGLADAFMYAEALSFTMAMTNISKMAVRRPRPIAYIEREAHADDPNYSNEETDSSLSFFSGHSAYTAAVGATATYLAFARSPHTARPWITLAAAVALNAFVSVERVRSGKHFPTDVIAGTIAGAGIGAVVPHLHRTDDIKQRRIWVGFAPINNREGGQGALLNVTGFW